MNLLIRKMYWLKITGEARIETKHFLSSFFPEKHSHDLTGKHFWDFSEFGSYPVEYFWNMNESAAQDIVKQEKE